jgi:uncharacterized membrane protein YraQ (UPF0718 family)/copper chaperone CopZ
MLQAVWNILVELSPWLLLGAVVAGLMHLLVPAGSLKRLLQGRGGILASVIVGIPLPLCSCSVIPVGIGLRKEGASTGASVGFLISTPQTGVDSILVSGSLLGWPFAIFKVFAALVMGLIGGGLTQLLGDDSESEQENEPATKPASEHESLTSRVMDAVAHSIELIRSIWRWLVIGILVSAVITWLMPANQLSSLAGASGVVAMLLTLVISLPLYVCATASVPIAAALVSAGLPAGAAIVFLMAGPATNLATLGAVYRTFGKRTTGVYLATMIVGSIAAGLLFDFVLPVQVAQNLTHHDHTNWLSVVCSAVMVGMIVWFAADDLKRWWHRKPATAGDLRYRITGMNCENCAAGLERDFKEVAGVEAATVHFSSEEAIISGNPSNQDILQVVSSKGLTATPVSSEQQLAGDSVTD